MNTPNFLRRYTDLPTLIYLLEKKKITFLDPRNWDDKNDSHHLGVYKERKSLQTLLAVCFTQASETYHHWKVFSPGPSGICIVFNKKNLIASLSSNKSIRCDETKYKTIEYARSNIPNIDDLPFIKRHPYRGEEEFRFIYERENVSLPSKDISFELSSIFRVVCSPWMHKNLADSTGRTLRLIEGCSGLKVVKSTLVNNEQWKKIGESAS